MPAYELEQNQQIVIELLEEPSSGMTEDEITTSGLGAFVVEVTDDRVWIEPFNAGIKETAVEPGKLLRVKSWDENGIYFQDLRIVEKKGGVFFKFAVEKPKSFQSIQRRRFFRLDLSIRFTFSLLQELNQRSETAPIYESKTEDISAGGIRFKSSLQLTEGTNLRLMLGMDGEKIVEAVGRVVRCIELDSDRQLFMVAVEFTKIEEKDRRELIRFLFDSQLELRKRLKEF